MSRWHYRCLRSAAPSSLNSFLLPISNSRKVTEQAVLMPSPEPSPFSLGDSFREQKDDLPKFSLLRVLPPLLPGTSPRTGYVFTGFARFCSGPI